MVISFPSGTAFCFESSSQLTIVGRAVGAGAALAPTFPTLHGGAHVDSASLVLVPSALVRTARAGGEGEMWGHARCADREGRLPLSCWLAVLALASCLPL